MSLVKYSFDTSAILDGFTRLYPPDVFPPLWRKLEELIDQGFLRATEEVKQELSKKDDDSYNWARSQPNLFVPIDNEIQLKVQEILRQFPRLVATKRNRSFADPFVIAFAQIESATIITGEKPTGSMNNPKIPDVCRLLGLSCINFLEFIRIEKWVLVGLETHST